MRKRTLPWPVSREADVGAEQEEMWWVGERMTNTHPARGF